MFSYILYFQNWYDVIYYFSLLEHLKYCQHTTAHSCGAKLTSLERLARNFLSWVAGRDGRDYLQRLKCLGLYSQERWREYSAAVKKTESYLSTLHDMHHITLSICHSNTLKLGFPNFQSFPASFSGCLTGNHTRPTHNTRKAGLPSPTPWFTRWKSTTSDCRMLSFIS